MVEVHYIHSYFFRPLRWRRTESFVVWHGCIKMLMSAKRDGFKELFMFAAGVVVVVASSVRPNRVFPSAFPCYDPGACGLWALVGCSVWGVGGGGGCDV
jgi:hypothetical protein